MCDWQEELCRHRYFLTLTSLSRPPLLPSLQSLLSYNSFSFDTLTYMDFLPPAFVYAAASRFPSQTSQIWHLSFFCLLIESRPLTTKVWCSCACFFSTHIRCYSFLIFSTHLLSPSVPLPEACPGSLCSKSHYLDLD